MSILRWHSSTAPAFSSSSSSSSKREPSAYEVLDEFVGDSRPFFQIVSAPLAFPALTGGESKVGGIWLSLFPSLVQLITRMRWPGADTALERIHLKQEHDAVYGKQEGIGAIDTSAYWYLAKLMTAGDVKDVIQLALNKNRSWVRKELLPESPASSEAGGPIQSTFDTQYYTTWYKGPPRPMVYSCCGQQIGPQTKGCWISLDPQNQTDETVIPYTLMPSSTAENMWSRLADDDGGLVQNLKEFLQKEPTIIKGTAFLDYNKFAALDREIQTTWLGKVLPLLAEAIRFYMQAMDESLQQEPPAPFPMNASQVVKMGENAVAIMDLWSALKHVIGLVYKFNEPQHKDGCKQGVPLLESEWNALFNSTILHVDIAKKYFTVEKRGFIKFIDSSGKQWKVVPLRGWSSKYLDKLAEQLPEFKDSVKDIEEYATMWNKLNAAQEGMSRLDIRDDTFTNKFKELENEAEFVRDVNTTLRTVNDAKISVAPAEKRAAVFLQKYYTDNLAARVSIANLVVEAKKKKQIVVENNVLNELRKRLQQIYNQLELIVIPSDQGIDLLNAKKLIVQDLQKIQQAKESIVEAFAPYFWINQTNKRLNEQESRIVAEQLKLFDNELQLLLTRAKQTTVKVDELNKLYQTRLTEIEKQKQLAAERQRQTEETERQRLVEVARLAEARRLQLEQEQQQQLLIAQQKRNEQLERKTELEKFGHVYHRVSKIDANIIVPKLPESLVTGQNFKWEAGGIGGTCPFDSMFAAMFKIPGLWLQRKINEATAVYSPSFECDDKDADAIHLNIYDDVQYLQGTQARQSCMSAKVWDKCVALGMEGVPGLKQGDDSRQVLRELFNFYGLSKNFTGPSELKKTEEENKIIWIADEFDKVELQLLIFSLSFVEKDKQMGAFEFQVPLTLKDFTLISSVSYRGRGNVGGHWITHVRDPRTKQWWKFDALEQVVTNVTENGKEVPNVVTTGIKDAEQPMAWYYVRTDSLPDYDEAANLAAQQQKFEKEEEARRAAKEKEDAETRKRLENQQKKDAEDRQQQLEEEARRAAEESEAQQLLDIQRKKAAPLQSQLPILERLITALEKDDELQVGKILNDTDQWPDNQCDLLAQAFQVSSNLPMDEYYRYLSVLMEQSSNDEMVRRLAVLFKTVQDERVLEVLNEIAQEK
jgi:hypothetical protein